MRFFDRNGFGTASAGRLTIPLPLLGATAGRVVAVFRTMTATSRRNAGLDDVVDEIISHSGVRLLWDELLAEVKKERLAWN